MRIGFSSLIVLAFFGLCFAAVVYDARDAADAASKEGPPIIVVPRAQSLVGHR